MKHAIPEHIVLRAGTVDRDIWHEAVEKNIYRLPHVFSPGDWVLNIGAHTGSVAWRCAQAGARVVCVEPSRENYHLLCHNLRPVWDRVLPIHAAAWRSDMGVQSLVFHPNWAPCNTGGGCVMGDAGGAGYETLAIPLDDILSLSAKWRALIMDCEGAEFPCLYTSKALKSVSSLVGEYHERDQVRSFADTGRPHTMAELREFLETKGFAVQVEEKGPGMGLFWATR